MPPGLKQRVRNYEWQRWAAMRGVDECEMIRNLPEGLRRDIKYHLCLDLVKQVIAFRKPYCINMTEVSIKMTSSNRNPTQSHGT